MLLLHHTAAESYYKVVIFLLVFFEYSDIAENPVLCVLTDGAGVIKHQIRFGKLLGKAVAHLS